MALAVAASTASLARTTFVAGAVSSVLEARGRILGLHLADVTGDGLLDAVAYVEQVTEEERSRSVEVDGQVVLSVEVVDVTTRRALVFAQRADATFETEPAPRMVPAEAKGFDVADLDGDGRAELLALMPDHVAALDEDGPRVIASVESVLASAGGLPPELDFAQDLDGNGREELLVPTHEGVWVRWDDGHVSNLPEVRGPRSGGEGRLRHGVVLPLVMDGNGDGLQDLVFVQDYGRVRVFLQKRRGEFVRTPMEGRWKLWNDEPSRFAGVAELTGDGWIDVLMSRPTGGEGSAVFLDVYAGRSDATFDEKPSASFDLGKTPKTEGLAFCRVLDLDGDGVSEVLATYLRVGGFQMVRAAVTKTVEVKIRSVILRWNGETFRQVGEVEDEMKVSLKRLSIDYLLSVDGDLDGDGLHDLIRPRGARLRVHRGLPKGGFSRDHAFELPAGDGEGLVGALKVVDLNGDDRDDVVVTRESWDLDHMVLRILVMEAGDGGEE